MLVSLTHLEVILEGHGLEIGTVECMTGKYGLRLVYRVEEFMTIEIAENLMGAFTVTHASGQRWQGISSNCLDG